MLDFMLTVSVIHHDSVAEGEQFEELWHILVFAWSDTGNQRMIHKLELSISKLVPVPVNRLMERRKKMILTQI